MSSKILPTAMLSDHVMGKHNDGSRAAPDAFHTLLGAAVKNENVRQCPVEKWSLPMAVGASQEKTLCTLNGTTFHSKLEVQFHEHLKAPPEKLSLAELLNLSDSL